MTSKERSAKVRKVMREFKAGTLKSSSGQKVENRRQAVAIALSEAGISKGAKTDAYWDSYVAVIVGEEEEEEGEEKTDAMSFAPPSAVRSAARRGLELRKKHGKGGLSTQEAGKQGIGSGVARATSLANGESVSYETIKRMAAFFSRHEKNFAGGEDDAGYISGLLWGGSAGRAWANRIIREQEAKQKER